MSSSASGPGDVPGLSVHADPGAARAADVRQLSGNINVGARLLSSATAFVFISFLFAFLYLRAVNSAGLWRPKGINPVQSWGIAVLVLVLLSSVLWDVTRRQVVSGAEPRWRSGSLTALGLGLLVVVAQALEWATISFRTDDGGWAAVFWGWTAVFLLFWLGALYWMETLVAQSLRRPPAAAREGTAGSELLRPSADGCVVYLYTLALIAVIAYVLLYLIK
jgi:heme/copper-type cytochrome/quinol oxidase subunit 3